MLFRSIHHLEFYSKKELTTIIMRSAQVLGVEIDVKGAGEIAMRSRGTPRLANRLLKRVRDFAQVKYDGVITKDVADFALDILDVDRLGLDDCGKLVHELTEQAVSAVSDLDQDGFLTALAESLTERTK